MFTRYRLSALVRFGALTFTVGLVGCGGSGSGGFGTESGSGSSTAGSDRGSSSSGGSASSSGSGSGSGGGSGSGVSGGSGAGSGAGGAVVDASTYIDAGSGTDGAASMPVDAGSIGRESGTSAGDSATFDGASTGLSSILVPTQGVLLGEYYGDGTIAQTEARIGRKPAIHLTYVDWVTDWTTDPTLTNDFAAGRIPQITWEPVGINFADIISGKLDATVQARATGAKALGKKFFLDFAAEMNSDQAWTQGDPVKYIAGYRHIHDIFVAAGATNVVWAWCPNVTDINGGNAMTMAYYPGDAYVDWTGVDGYNWGTSASGFSWQTFHDVFVNIYPLLAAKGKPILIGEMASDEVGGDKAQWIGAIIPTLRASFPLIKALTWFDVLKERQWLINSSPASLAAYQAMAKDPYMNP